MTDHLAVLESVEATLGCLDNPAYHATFPRFELKEREALRAAIALMRGQSETCAWQKDDDEWEGAHWDSACGEKYFFVEGGPADNGHKFCHGCGKPLHIIEPKDTADE